MTGRDECEHGSLRRACALCAAEEEIAELNDQIRKLEAAVRSLMEDAARYRSLLQDCKSGLIRAMNSCNPKAPERLQQRCFEQTDELLERIDAAMSAEKPITRQTGQGYEVITVSAGSPKPPKWAEGERE